MPNIETEQQQYLFDLLHEVWMHDRSVDDAFEELDCAFSMASEQTKCPACDNEKAGVVSGGTQHTCL